MQNKKLKKEEFRTTVAALFGDNFSEQDGERYTLLREIECTEKISSPITPDKFRILEDNISEKKLLRMSWNTKAGVALKSIRMDIVASNATTEWYIRDAEFDVSANAAGVTAKYGVVIPDAAERCTVEIKYVELTDGLYWDRSGEFFGFSLLVHDGIFLTDADGNRIIESKTRIKKKKSTALAPIIFAVASALVLGVGIFAAFGFGLIGGQKTPAPAVTTGPATATSATTPRVPVKATTAATTSTTAATKRPLGTTVANPPSFIEQESIPAPITDIDFYEGYASDAYRGTKLVLYGNADIVQRDVTFGGITNKAFCLNSNSNGDYGYLMLQKKDLDKILNGESGFAIELLYVNRVKNGTQGIFCFDEKGGLGLWEKDGVPTFSTYCEYEEKYCDVSAAAASSTSELTHVIITGVVYGDYTYIYLYVNGKKVASEVIPGRLATEDGNYPYSLGAFSICSDIAGGNPTSDCSVVDIRIYDVMFGQKTAQAAYNEVSKAFPKPEKTVEELFAESGYNAEDYVLLDFGKQLGTYYNSTKCTPAEISYWDTYWCTPVMFTKDTLPNGSLLVVAEGYKYRPDGWADEQTLTESTKRPENVLESITVVDDEWWGDLPLRVFNVCRQNDAKLTEEDLSAFAIYVPKSSTVEVPASELTIFLDPGHGGKDPGSTRTYDDATYREADINLAVALKAQAKLEALGYNVVLSRTDDTFIEIADRPAAAIGAGANMFISIHVNSHMGGVAHGFEAYYSGKSTLKYDAKAFADLFTKEFAEIKELTLTGSDELAYPNMHIRGTKADTELYINGLAVLNQKEVYIPSTLLELGFITNDNDFLMLKSVWWQNHAAEAIADAVVAAHVAGIYKK